jgi:hypothetical protein
MALLAFTRSSQYGLLKPIYIAKKNKNKPSRTSKLTALKHEL